MSLIHKALKKAEGTKEDDINPSPPIEEFIGKKAGQQITPRTILLFVLVILSLVFMVYKRFYKRPAPFPPPQPVAAAPAAARPAGGPAVPGPMPQAGAVPLGADVASLVEGGRAHYAKNELDQALAQYNQASVLDPGNADVLNSIGLIYKKKGDLAQAESFYKKALAVKHDCSQCLNNLGVLKMMTGDRLSAALYLKDAVKYNSTYADAYFNLAVLNDEEGNFKGAIENYKLFLQYTDAGDEALIGRVEQRIEQLSE